MIAWVERLQHHREFRGREDVARTTEHLHGVRGLIRQVDSGMACPKHHCAPLCVHALGDIHRVACFLQKLLHVALVIAGESRCPCSRRVEHKHAHLDVEAIHRRSNFLLFLNRAPTHPVIFPRAEPDIRSELELVDRVIPCVMAEHPKVGRELHIEWTITLGRMLLAQSNCCGGSKRAGTCNKVSSVHGSSLSDKRGFSGYSDRPNR